MHRINKKECWPIWALIVMVLLLGVLVLGYCQFGRINKVSNSLTHLEERYATVSKTTDITPLNKKFQIKAIDPSIEFLQSEIRAHQEFIERERTFLLWMLGVILSGAVFILGFLGYKRKQDIEDIIDKEYRKEIQKQFEESLYEIIGKDDNIQYLQSAIEKEKKARNKNICFFIQSDNLQTQIELFRGFLEPFGGEVHNGNFDQCLDEYSKFDVFVYEVDENENNDNLFNEKEIKNETILSKLLHAKAEHESIYNILYKKSFDDQEIKEYLKERISQQNYKKLNNWCKKNEKKCVLYCHNNIKVELNPEIGISQDITTTVKFPSKLVETLYTLLYLPSK